MLHVVVLLVGFIKKVHRNVAFYTYIKVQAGRQERKEVLDRVMP